MTGQGYDLLYRAQNGFVKYLQRSLWPAAERLRAGQHRGTITGPPGIVWDVRIGDHPRLTPWMGNLFTVRRRTRALHGFLVVKPDAAAVNRCDDWLAFTDWPTTGRWLWPHDAPAQLWPHKPLAPQLTEALRSVKGLFYSMHTLTETRNVLCTEVSTALALLKKAGFGGNE